MNTLHVEAVATSESTEVGYLLINKAAKAIAIVNPIPNIVGRLNQYTQTQNYSLDWVLLTHLPRDNSTLLRLQSQFSCVFTSSLAIIQQLPKSLLANSAPLENHEVLMLGHLEVEAVTSGKFVNYKINGHIFLNDDKLSSMLKSINFLQSKGGLLIFLEDNNENKDIVKDFGIGAQILHKLGIKNVKLLTSGGKHSFIGMGGFGLELKEEIQIN